MATADLNQRLLEKADVILESVITSVQKLGDVAVEQLPVIAGQFLQFSFIWNLTILILWFIAFILFFYGGLYKLGIKNVAKLNTRGENPALFFIWLFSIIGGLGSFAGIIVYLKTVLMISLIPSLYIVKEIASLLK